MKDKLKKIRFYPEKEVTVTGEDPFKEEYLGFEEPVKRLSLLMDDIETPFTMAIYGPWGSGKTSFMRMLKVTLEKEEGSFSTFWFDAWKYENEHSLILPLLSKLAEEKGLKEEFKDKAKKIGAAILFGATNFLSGGIVDDARKGLELYEEQAEKIYNSWVSEIDKLSEEFEELVNQIKSKDKKETLVIFIDDLDRCLPDNVIKVIEGIKHFLASKGCIFVLGVDRDVLSKGIEARYGSQLISGNEYLEKIINISFSLPSDLTKDLGRFISSNIKAMCDPEWYETIRENVDAICNTILSSGVEHNPRKLKAVAKRILLYLSSEYKGRHTIENVCAILLLREFFPAVYEYMESIGKFVAVFNHYESTNVDKDKFFGLEISKELDILSTKQYVNFRKDFLKVPEVNEQSEGLFQVINHLYSFF